ncbi:MAG: glutaredoxin domain-containing protein [archaeon]
MTVTIYTTPTCHFCHLAKDFFKENKIAFVEKDCSDTKNAQDAVTKSGQMGVPVIDVDGKIILGFNKPELQKALKLK